MSDERKGILAKMPIWLRVVAVVVGLTAIVAIRACDRRAEVRRAADVTLVDSEARSLVSLSTNASGTKSR